MVSVLAYAGLRPQELLAWQWDDVLSQAIFGPPQERRRPAVPVGQDAPEPREAAHTAPCVARQAGHSVAVCDRHYAGIFDDVDPATRVTAEAAIRAARGPGVRGVCALFDAEGEER